MTTNDSQTLDPKTPVPAAPEADEGKQKLSERFNIRAIMPVLGFVVILGFFAIATGGSILTPKNLTLMLSGSYVLMIASVGVFMIMTMGCLDFSQGSMLGVTCIVVCTLSKYNVVLAIVGGIVAGGCIGAINAYFHVRRQIPSFIVTMCMMFLLRGVCAYLTTDAPAAAASYMTDFNQLPFMLGCVVVVLLIVFFLYRFTALGSNLKAIGAGEKAARFAGVNVNRTKVLVYVAAGCITGFAAFLSAIRNGSVTSTAGNMLETQILIALVLGGMPISGGAKARFSNVVMGVLSYEVLQKGLVMMGFTTEIQQLIMGVVFLIVVALFSDRDSIAVIK
ncbi:MAG: ABC transporter permease [Atopobiaceae bacterium]|jgi:ribose transport system permease protein|nr:ABC transporter permease [Atopobiaceae bacterium]MCI2173990.1 ABC transporter permease [Atopobiaceae bacterium]MCI2207920.1 ABC transporter permease [Atopobiaceae bacterium]